MEDRSGQVKDTYDYFQGYELGCEDCGRGILPRFRQDHSDFAKGYKDGYTNHVSYLQKQHEDGFDIEEQE